ncbi:LacI family transcriptional regulator [Endozoicomonas montiporae]|uniref:LacI family transcriptional regulator n=2 Tax=Endozoicomonas montiporae TaxID=1027273 RepID=A0A081MZ18_9GAMM|nr:LacI family DNA-binding transcriptional regulator [Endozoicomonas montiporae]AMO54917.1 LacI family sugar-binding transcriptional regulator [Endozoicomonas montiporae CL-33]KEQ11441.1 LacI family transcriptional regulator [Endozoicomonas montiporae]
MKATIKDVAREAKVSISTVSYAINGKDRISEKTRQHVLKVAKKLNYVANGNAKLLKQKNTRAIGIFFNSWFGPIYSEIARGIEKAVHQAGYDLVACSLYGEENSTAYKYLRDRMVDGAIILTNSFDDEFLTSMASKELPLVVLDREIQSPHIYSILIDNFGGAFTATKAIVKSGVREVYFLGGPEDSYDNQKRLDGYIAALGFCGVPVNHDFILECDFTEEGAYRKMSALFDQGTIPDAIFSANDEMALGIYRAARERNLRIPKDIKVVGFDNIRESAVTTPPLTTISHQQFEMGISAAETLFHALKGNDDIEYIRIQPTKLIERESL